MNDKNKHKEKAQQFSKLFPDLEGLLDNIDWEAAEKFFNENKDKPAFKDVIIEQAKLAAEQLSGKLIKQNYRQTFKNEVLGEWHDIDEEKDEK